MVLPIRTIRKTFELHSSYAVFLPISRISIISATEYVLLSVAVLRTVCPIVKTSLRDNRTDKWSIIASCSSYVSIQEISVTYQSCDFFYSLSTKRRLARPLHGSSTPLWFSQSRPHCLRRTGYRSDCDWTRVSLYPLPVIAIPEATQYLKLDVLAQPIRRHGVSVKVATAVCSSSGNVLDVCLFSFQRSIVE